MKKTVWILLMWCCLAAMGFAWAQAPAGKPPASSGGYAKGWDATVYQNNQGPFMSNCKASCQRSIQSDPKLGPYAAKLNVGGYCNGYCGCSLKGITKRVPYMDFAAYGLGQASAQTKQVINAIINECGKSNLGILTGGR